MKKYCIILILILASGITMANTDVPTLITKSYIDNLIYSKITPLEQQLADIDSQFKTLNQQLNNLQSKASLQVAVTIDQTTAYINNQPQTLDVPPRIENDRTFVPVSFIGQAFGAEFSWDEKNQKVTYNIDRNKIELFIGKNIAYINGNMVLLDAPPFIHKDRTLVPFSFMGQSIGAQVEWNTATRTATISK